MFEGREDQTMANNVAGGAVSHDAAEIHMPAPSYWPIVVAAGITVVAVGFLIHPIVVVAGVLIVIASIIAWGMEESHA